MKTCRVIALAAVILMVVATLLAGCSPIKKEMVGEWSYTDQSAKMTYVFNQDGTMEYKVTLATMGGGNNSKKSEGACETKGDNLIISGIYIDVESKEYTYMLSDDGKTLTLTRDGDDIVLTKVE